MIEINNLTKCPIPETFLPRVARMVLKGEKKEHMGLSIALVGPQKARELNEMYRKKDTMPNVLSFKGQDTELGEVVICPLQVKKEARKYGMMFEAALAWMLVHGMLHLLGYGHKKASDAKAMEQKEQFYLSRI